LARSAREKGREPLSRGRIELAAFDLIERDGLAAFSTRRLAAELGCEAMSIYHYFPSKAHLMDALADRVIGEMPPPPPPHLPWIERARILARDWHATMTKRPNLFLFLATFRMNTPTCLAWLEATLGFFCESGLGREEGARLFRAMGYYLMGAGLDETAGYSEGASTAEPVPDEVMRRDYPNVVVAGPYFHPSGYGKTFELGLDLFLESIERLIAEREKQGAVLLQRR
jgi:AcrR family transcriptional regulator